MKKKKQASLAGKSIISIAIVIAVCTLISISARFISPQTYWLPALFGLGFKHFYIINFLFLIYFLFRKRRALVISLIPFIIGFTTAQTVLRIGISSPEIDKSKAVKILSYNVRLFDLYNWTSNLQTRQKILEMLHNEDADILCLQEFYTADDQKFRNLDTLLRSQRARKYHIEYQKSIKGKYHFGIATLSSYPIINKGHILFSKDNSNVCIFSDLKINDDTIRIYNAHLESIRFKQEDYEFVDKLAERENRSGADIQRAGNILKRLKSAYIKRSRQAEIIRDHISSSPYHVVLCGDFNDSPTSYCYKVISEGLTDAFMVSGRGLGNSYTGPFPAFRIDFIMHDPMIRSGYYRTTREALSDHYPVSCYLELP